MRYELTLPARINILGNPSDGLEGDHCTISAAIELRAGASIEPADHIILERRQRDEWGNLYTTGTLELQGLPPYPYDGQQDLVKGAINRLYASSPELRDKLRGHGVRLGTWTDVPRQSGLGGSTLFVLLTLAGLRKLYDLDPRAHNDYLLCEMAQRVESEELGITCGFADRYVPLFGGLAYLDYRGKLFHKPLRGEPYATYERLDGFIDQLALVAAHTGVMRDSGDVHSVLRKRYLEEYTRGTNGSDKSPFMVRTMQAIGDTAWRGKIALLENDLERFGQLMAENHRLVDQMMAYCGFSEGVGRAANVLIEAALANGALGAKLTGAGGGGSVFALVRPGQETDVALAMHDAARQHGLDRAYVFTIRLASVGLTVETLVQV